MGTVAVVPPRLPAPRSARVFVTYAHESPEHKEQVLDLCRFLHRSGLDVRVDEWASSRRRDWSVWMTNEVRRADFVIVIASEAYRRAAEGEADAAYHRGVQSEAAILRDLLHANRTVWLPKMLPVILPGRSVDHIPLFLQPACADHYRITEISTAGCADLLAALTGTMPEFRRAAESVPALPPYTPIPHAATAQSPRGPTLPRNIRSFTGRESELEAILSAAAGDDGQAVSIHAVDGMPGVGKTAFAVHVAHRLAHRFPDGLIFLELHGHSHGQEPVTTAAALASLLLETGVAGDQIPTRLSDRIRLWRERVKDKRMLIVLDDAHGHEQIADLLPVDPGCLVLITSRRRLAALEDAHCLTLGVLDNRQATELFLRLVPETEVGPHERHALATLMRLCGYLPLAISVLAGRLRSHPTWTLTHLAERLCQAQRLVPELGTGGPTVAAAFDLSYRALPRDQQRLFRRLGLHPGADFDVHTAAALDNADVVETRRRLDALYLDSLIDEPVLGRYRLHDLVHEYSHLLLDEEPEHELKEATDRLLDHYLRVTLATSHQIPGDALVPTQVAPLKTPRSTAVALKWLETERSNLLACAEFARESGRLQFVIQLSAALHSYLRLSGRWDQARVLHRAALAATRRHHDRHSRALAHRNLGVIEWLLDDYPSALKNLDAARGLYRRRDPRGYAATLIDLGAVYSVTDEYDLAIQHLDDAYANYHRMGDALGQAIALSELGATQARNHDYRAATVSSDLAFALFQRLGDRRGQANVLNVRATIYHAGGRFSDAIQAAIRAQGHYIELGDVRGQAITFNVLGAVCCSTGEYDQAISNHTQAFERYAEIGSILGQAFTLNNLGCALRGAGEHVAANAALTRAHDIFSKLNKRTGQAEALNNLGELARTWPQAGHPADLHGQALVLARQTQVALEEARALEGLGLAGLLTNSPTALDNLKQAQQLYQNLRAPQAIAIATVIASIEASQHLTLEPGPSRRRLLGSSPWPRRGRHRFRRRHSRD